MWERKQDSLKKKRAAAEEEEEEEEEEGQDDEDEGDEEKKKGNNEERKKSTKGGKGKEKERKKTAGKKVRWSSGASMSQESRAQKKASTLRACSPPPSGPSPHSPSASGPSFSGPSSSTGGGFSLTDLMRFQKVLANESSTPVALERALIRIQAVQEEEQVKLASVQLEMGGRSELMDAMILDFRRRLGKNQSEQLEPRRFL